VLLNGFALNEVDIDGDPEFVIIPGEGLVGVTSIVRVVEMEAWIVRTEELVTADAGTMESAVAIERSVDGVTAIVRETLGEVVR
jgi:hypothetical protein